MAHDRNALIRSAGSFVLVVSVFLQLSVYSQKVIAHNPVIFADVPDASIIRVDNAYYMSSTTMHMSPGVPIMKSDDLVNWKLIGYAHDTLAAIDALNLDNGKSAYGRGSWASSIRFHNGTYYVSTFAQTTDKTYIYSTKDLEKGPWQVSTFSPSYHDHTLWFDDDGRIYMIYGVRKLRLIELNEDLSGIRPGTQEKIIIEDASAPANADIMLGAEGSQLFKVNGKYYLFNITWPNGGMRTVIIHRADRLTGPWEGRVGLQHLGVAQGGLIDTPDGKWFSYLFRDYGSVGRIPYLVPVKWEDGWPVLGLDGRVPDTLDLPPNKSLIPGIAQSDDFARKNGDRDLPLAWQWNHNPDNKHWSLKDRKGYLRLKSSRVDTSFHQVRNILTQRTIGPKSSATVLVDVSGMKDGDFAGLTLFQKRYGQVGVKYENGRKSIVVVSNESEVASEMERVQLGRETVYLKAECNFEERSDTAQFFYSLNGKTWIPIGGKMKMSYTLPHFMGYRYGLFIHATKSIGGHADFDFFEITEIKTD